VIASLGVYDRPETRAANDEFWRLIRDNLRRRGVNAPDQLNHSLTPVQTWLADDLVLAQTCGLPFRQYLCGRVNLVGTPDYGLKDCPPGHYRSAFVVRQQDRRTGLVEFADAVFAYNEEMSQSGWAAPQCHAASRGFRFSRTLATGGHLDAARAVAEGRADIAALDALTWDMIRRFDRFSARLRVLEWTKPTPGLPYICGAAIDADLVFDAVDTAIGLLDPPDRRALRIRRLVRIDQSAYLSVPNP